jgi:hypothetical protein
MGSLCKSHNNSIKYAPSGLLASLPFGRLWQILCVCKVFGVVMFEYDNCSKRWNSIYSFIEGWTGVKLEQERFKDLISETEARLGIILPSSVKHWISFSKSSSTISEYFSYRDCLEIEWLEELDSLSLLLQSESDVYWGIKRKHLRLDDPPVTVYYLDYDSPDNKFYEQGEWAPSLSCFALDYLFSYFRPTGGDFALSCSISDKISRKLENEISYGVEFGALKIYVNENTLVFTNLNEENWNNDRIKCLFKRKVDVDKFTPFLSELLSKAIVLSGEFANSRIA